MRLRRFSRKIVGSLLQLTILLVLAIVGVHRVLQAPTSCCTPSAAELSAADADRCCDGEVARDGGDQERCPCPLPCSPGCTGHAMRALTSSPSNVVAVAAAFRVDQALSRARPPPVPEPADILHVPKSLRA